MRISKDEPERRTLVIPKPEAVPEHVEPTRPANEPEQQPQQVPEPIRRVA